MTGQWRDTVYDMKCDLTIERDGIATRARHGHGGDIATRSTAAEALLHYTMIAHSDYFE